MAGRNPGRTTRGNQQCLAAQLNGLARRGKRLLKCHQGHVAGTEEAPINRAEAAHHAIVSARNGVAQVHIPRLIQVEIAETPRGKYQLTGKTELIESARTVLALE